MAVDSQIEWGYFRGYLTCRTERLLSMSGGIRARGTNKLSDARIKAFIADARAGKAPTKKLADGGGLYITVTTTGSAVWRIKYRYGGKERVYADIGAYPEAGLQKAREERDRVREMLRQGRDPVKGRKIDQIESAAASGQTFGTVAEEWLRERQKGWAAIHYDKSKRALERDVLPDLGKMPVREITPAMIALVIKSVIKRGAGDTAGKILQQISGILRLAQASGYSAENPADPVRELIPRKKFTARRPAILEWNGLGAVLRGAEAARLSPAVRMAHRLCAFTAARISNVVQAQWSEFELDAEVPVWVIPRAQMKAQDREHDHKIFWGRPLRPNFVPGATSSAGRATCSPPRSAASTSLVSQSRRSTASHSDWTASIPRTVGARRSRHWLVTTNSSAT